MNKAVFIIAVLLISGCASARRAASGSWAERSSGTQTESCLSEEKAEARHEEKCTEAAQTLTQIGEEVTVVTEVFDTSQPADPATGYPPLIERTTVNSRMAAVSQQNKETDRRAVATSRYSIRERSESRATIETDSRAEIATDKKRGVPRLLHWLAAVGGAGILYGLFRLIKLFKIF